MPQGRPLGLIAIVLILDLGLATAGGVLLRKGLASKDAKKSDATSESAPSENKAEAPAPPAIEAIAAAPAPASAPASIVSAPARASASAPLSPAPASPPAQPIAAAREPRADAAKQREKAPPTVAKQVEPANTKSQAAPANAKTQAEPAKAKTQAAPAKATKQAEPAKAKKQAEPAKDPLVKARPDDGPVTHPEDPYQTPNTEQEIERAAAKSKAAFDRCAARSSPHGSIKIALQVRGDGRVINAAAVENTTGSSELAHCLVAEVSTWTVSAHDGAAINLVRPFTYP